MSGTFTYVNPRVIHWGAGSRRQLNEELSRLGVSRVGVVTTRSLADSIERLGLHPATVVVVGQHAPASHVDAGVEQARRERVDGLVSFGGGSAIDSAKIMSIRAGGDDLALPHVAIPTT
ncbi:MAG TPA: iron-containing alcohol dehydrogenase, partial [Candidatus Dormibacteraeota bacterium]|nr:iron-containing alcohol dehydrogenase [Candidatus Dormibacteraeota bacterium]